jgi:hypothetical protein
MVRGIPIAAYFVGLYALKFRVPVNSQIDAAFGAIVDAKGVPPRSQMFSIRLLRDRTNTIVKASFPLVEVDFDKAFNAVYCTRSFGSPADQRKIAVFLTSLQDGIIKKDAVSIMNLMDANSKRLKHSLMECSLVSLHFKWERISWWARLERWTYPIVIITGILSFIPVLPWIMPSLQSVIDNLLKFIHLQVT